MTHAKQRSRKAQKEVRLYSVTEAARILDCSDMHVYRQIGAGELHAIDIGTPGSGRTKSRIRSDELDDYINRRAAGVSGDA
jgi:excisionase family DNA binding protein